MKKLLALFVFLILVFSNTARGQFSWSLQNSSGTTGMVRDLHFINDDIGWAVGDNALILATTDGGLNWQTQTILGSQNLYDVHFINSQKGWIMANGGTVYKTTTGGDLWTPVSTVPFTISEGIRFNNDTLGWASGFDGTIGYLYKTIDGGTTWSAQNLPSALSGLWKIDFPTDLNGWAVGYSGIVNSTDGGENWFSQTNPTGESLEDVCMINELEGWAVGLNGAIIHTEDGGVNWVTQISGVSFTLWDVDFIDAENGMAVGSGGEVLYTTTGGDTWITTSDFMSTGVDFESLHMHDFYTAHIGGSFEKIYKSPIPENDLVIIAYHGLDTVCAGVPVQVILTIYNNGPGPIENADFVISDGVNPILYYQWSGNLFAGAYQDIDLGTVTVFNSGVFFGAISGDSITNNNLSDKYIYVQTYDAGVSGPHFICPGEEVTINAFGGNSYYWYNATGDSTNQFQTVQPNSSTSYNVLIKTENCSVPEKLDVIITDCDALVTAISPNNDGLNDKLVIDEIVGFENEVKIFNRWGDIVKSFTNYNNQEVAWDGTDENGNNLVESTYYYTYEVPSLGISKSSWVQVVR